jgi:hypothetical protein
MNDTVLMPHVAANGIEKPANTCHDKHHADSANHQPNYAASGYLCVVHITSPLVSSRGRWCLRALTSLLVPNADNQEAEHRSKISNNFLAQLSHVLLSTTTHTSRTAARLRVGLLARVRLLRSWWGAQPCSSAPPAP